MRHCRPSVFEKRSPSVTNSLRHACYDMLLSPESGRAATPCKQFHNQTRCEAEFVANAGACFQRVRESMSKGRPYSDYACSHLLE
jgi:hypothetical protein